MGLFYIIGFYSMIDSIHKTPHCCFFGEQTKLFFSLLIFYGTFHSKNKENTEPNQK